MKPKSGKSLKAQNRPILWLTLAVNIAGFYIALNWVALAETGIYAIVTTVMSLLPIGLTVVITTLANGLVPADWKARLVFWRWNEVLPGHRAFSYHGPNDARVNMVSVLEAVGATDISTPHGENRAWYSLFKSVEGDAAVSDVHRDFLFARDYASLSLLIILILGPTALLLVRPFKVCAAYVCLLLAQYLIVRLVAATLGNRFVCTVLARCVGAKKGRT